MVLIDTSSWTHALRRKGDPAIRRRVEQLMVATEATWCDVVRLELWHGARDGMDRESLRQLETEIPALAITGDVWNVAWASCSVALNRLGDCEAGAAGRRRSCGSGSGTARPSKSKCSWNASCRKRFICWRAVNH